MHPALSTSYLLPAIFLNPVLFLHGLNTILSRIIPPVVVAESVQPPPYSAFGPSANHPHLDVHASDNLCWSYTLVMICAQLMAFGRVHRLREESKEQGLHKGALVENGKLAQPGKPIRLTNGHATSHSRGSNGSIKSRGRAPHSTKLEKVKVHSSVSQRSSPDSGEESEVIL